jgi:TatD DNase family protein
MSIVPSPVELIDIGVNLTHDSFERDREEVIDAAVAVGVTRLIVTGTDVAATEAALRLARLHAGTIYCTAGVHPHHASTYDSGTSTQLAEFAQDPAVRAIGECGLDYFRNFSSPHEQRIAFERQLSLAVDCRLPVFLHQRDAHGDFTALLKDFRPHLIGGVAHCFTGGRAELEQYLELELCIGVTGWVCDERRGGDLVAAVPHIPLERLLLETDAPYLLPRDLKPPPAARRNVPSVLPHILQRVSALRDSEESTVGAATTANAERLFRLPAAEPA